MKPFGPHVAKPAPGTPSIGELSIGDSDLHWKVGIKTGPREYTIQAAFSAEGLADAYVAALQLRHPGKIEAIVLTPVEVWNATHPPKEVNRG